MSRNYLLQLPQKELKLIRFIGKEARKRGWSAYLVGGVVRDLLLKEPNLDLDIVVEGDAINLGRSLANQLKVRFVTYQQFGTATLYGDKGNRMDLSTARFEHYPYPGALPVVKGGTIKDDLFRRDFTVNAMAMALDENHFGRLVDYYGGEKDLRNRKIRILHKKSFWDDPTRILRAVRFEQRLGFRLEPQTLKLLKEALKRGLPGYVTSPRYFAEFKKILRERSVIKPLRRLEQLGGMASFHLKSKIDFPKIAFMEKKLNALPPGVSVEKWVVHFLAITESWEERQRQEFRHQFQLDNQAKRALQEGQDKENVVGSLLKPGVASSDIYKVLQPYGAEVIVYIWSTTRNRRIALCIERFWDKLQKIKLRINGDDLKKLGITSGVEIGRVLQELLYFKLDRSLPTKNDELKVARNLAGG